MAVDRCICFKVPFAVALECAATHGCHTVADLQKHLDLGKGCGLCVPYMQRALITGETDLPVLGEEEMALLRASAGAVWRAEVQ